MKAGDRVSRDGRIARVLEELPDGRLLLDTPDGPKPYARASCKPAMREVRPAAMTRVGKRELAAANALLAGATRDEVCAEYGITRDKLADWLRKVREATEDARMRASLGRVG